MSTGTLLDSVDAPGKDMFTCLSVAPFEALVLLGCFSGTLRTVQLVDAAGQGAIDGRTVHRMTLLPGAGMGRKGMRRA